MQGGEAGGSRHVCRASPRVPLPPLLGAHQDIEPRKAQARPHQHGPRPAHPFDRRELEAGAPAPPSPHTPAYLKRPAPPPLALLRSRTSLCGPTSAP
jgi:hypothetical protein